MSAAGPSLLVRSRHVSRFAHMGAVYLYHDLFGFILQMSPDVLDFLDAFADGGDVSAICSQWAGRFEDTDPQVFVDTFLQFHCLVDPEADEVALVWEYVPVRAKWTVWRQEDDGGVTLFTAWGERPIARHRLTPDEAKLWQSFDGERSLMSRLRDGYQPDFVEKLIQRLVHHDVQAVKLSPVPVSTYRGRRDLQPPYLTSTMPYPPYDGDAREVHEPDGSVSPAEYYKQSVTDADRQFDHQETTLAHLLRVPHPALAGRTYGAALIRALEDRAELPERVRVLEIGGGLGFVAEAVCRELADHGREVDYTILELSPALAAAQRERCADLPVTVREGDVLEVELDDSAYDIVIANEMIGDLPAIKLTRAQAGLDLEDPAARDAALAALGETGRLVRELGLEISDAPDPFYLTWGAFALVERAGNALAPGGILFVSEFGDLARYPRLSTHLDHPEVSIHFGLLEQAARHLGLDAEIVFVMDLIELDRELQGLATTRSYFRALEALLAEHEVTLEKIGYTREMFHELIDGKIDPTRFGDIAFDKIEDRLMGLVPHEFKAIVARRGS